MKKVIAHGESANPDQVHVGEVLSAPCDVVLSGESVVQPDILFVVRGRLRIITEEEIRGAPDLIAEILSPSTAKRDRTLKRTLYARYGVRGYWLVDPDSQMIEVLTLGARSYRRAGLYQRGQVLESPLFSGLKISLDQILNPGPSLHRRGVAVRPE